MDVSEDFPKVSLPFESREVVDIDTKVWRWGDSVRGWERDMVILLGQKNTLAEYMILFSADNRPPMLDKDLIPHPRDDPISFLNKAMAFLFLKGRQGQSYSSIGYKSKATSFGGNNTSEHARVVKCNNGQDSGKCFTPQQELSAEQAFWLRISNPTIESSNKPPVKVEVPSELPMVSLVNTSLKKLKFHLSRFDSVVKKRTTRDTHTEGEWGFEHTKAVFNNEIIPFLKSIKYIFNVFDKDLLNEIMEVQTVFDQMDAAVQQSSVDKQCLEIAKK
ncbi:hypothetical protein Tco_0537117 [Tanacetum coccineum]